MKKNFLKKRLVSFLVGSLATMCLAGCSGKFTDKLAGSESVLNPDNPVSITIWHYYNGDQYIKSAAEVFVESVPENTLISRPGGDEFYILFYGYSSRSEIQRYLDQLEKDIRAQSILLPNGDPFMLHLSAGVAWYPDDTTDR